MARGGRPNKSNPRVDDVIYALRTADDEQAKHLLKEVGVDAPDGYLRTALLWSTFYNNLNMVAWLLESGATINHQDRNGYSALHFAGQERRIEGAQLLINKGIELELADIHGNTALWTSIYNAKGDYRLVNLLLQHGANLDHRNRYQKTPREMLEATTRVGPPSLSE